MNRTSFRAAALTVTLAALSATTLAEQSTPPAPVEVTPMAQAQEAFGHYLSAWSARHAAPENLAEIFSDGAVVELNIPTRPDWSLHIEGRQAIQTFVGEVSLASKSWTFSAVRYFPTQQDNVVFAQYTSTTQVDGQVAQQTNLVIIELDGSRIAHLRDLNGAQTVTLALAAGRKVAAVPAGDAPGQ